MSPASMRCTACRRFCSPKPPPQSSTCWSSAGAAGLELRSLGQAQPGWRFTAVDPSGPMLALARQIVGEVAERTTFVEGLIDDAPPGPFDAASCLLTLHFLPPADRQPTLRAMRRRLTPGAPLVVAHSSFPQADRDRWLDRYQAFALSSGAPKEEVASAREAVAASVHLLEPSHDELLLRQAGFKDVELFYAAFTWRGWVARA